GLVDPGGRDGARPRRPDAARALGAGAPGPVVEHGGPPRGAGRRSPSLIGTAAGIPQVATQPGAGGVHDPVVSPTQQRRGDATGPRHGSLHHLEPPPPPAPVAPP